MNGKIISMLAIGLMALCGVVPMMSMAKPMDNPTPFVASLNDDVTSLFPYAENNYSMGTDMTGEIGFEGTGLELLTGTLYVRIYMYWVVNHTQFPTTGLLGFGGQANFVAYTDTDYLVNYTVNPVTNLELPFMDTSQIVYLEYGAFVSEESVWYYGLSPTFTINPPETFMDFTYNSPLFEDNYTSGDNIFVSVEGSGVNMSSISISGEAYQGFLWGYPESYYFDINETLNVTNTETDFWVFGNLTAITVTHPIVLRLYFALVVGVGYDFMSCPSWAFTINPEEETPPPPPPFEADGIRVTITQAGDWSLANDGTMTADVGSQITIKAQIECDDGIDMAQVIYTAVGGSDEEIVDMELISGDDEDGVWQATIPAQTEAGYLTFQIYVVSNEDVDVTTPETQLLIRSETPTAQPFGISQTTMIILVIGIIAVIFAVFIIRGRRW